MKHLLVEYPNLAKEKKHPTNPEEIPNIKQFNLFIFFLKTMNSYDRD